MPNSTRLCTMLHITHRSRLHWRSPELDMGLDSISRLTNQLLLDVHFPTYPPDCLQCIGMICKCGIGGPRSTTSVSTPTTQPPNSPNPHRGQYLCTHSRLPYPLPQPISIPSTGGKQPDTGRTPN